MKKILYFLLAAFVFGSFGITSVKAAMNSNAKLQQIFPVSRISILPINDLEELLKTATELYRQKKYDEALEICKKASEMNPTDFRPHAVAGYIYMAQWKLKSASDSFAKAISLKPDNKRLYIIKAKADERRGAKEEAMATARKALEIDPTFGEAFEVIGDLLRYDEKRRDEAIAAYRSAIKANSLLFSAYESLAETLQTAKDEKGAEEIFRKAMELDPKKCPDGFR